MIVAVFVPVTLRPLWPLAEKGIPIQDFCRWLGHTPKVALEFSMQVRSASYDRAAASIVTVDPSTLRSA